MDYRQLIARLPGTQSRYCGRPHVFEVTSNPLTGSFYPKLSFHVHIVHFFSLETNSRQTIYHSSIVAVIQYNTKKNLFRTCIHAPLKGHRYIIDSFIVDANQKQLSSHRMEQPTVTLIGFYSNFILMNIDTPRTMCTSACCF